MADLADHAYAHAVAVLGAGEPALEAAIVAVRRGGRSRSAVLGHTRAESLLRSADAASVDLDRPIPDDLTALAGILAATRPPVERAVIDLEGRHGLDRPGFGRALGTSTAAAGTRASEVGVTWERVLDPVVLARLGPGGCDGLAAALGATLGSPESSGTGDDAGGSGTSDGTSSGGGDPPRVAPQTLRELVGLGPAVIDHAAGCSVCADRLRSMVSVRSLLAQRALDAAPSPVRAAAAPSRLRRPAAPPPLEPAPVARRWFRPVLSVVLATVVAGGGGAIAANLRTPGRETGTVEALTRMPEAGSVLVASPAAIEGRAPAPVKLANTSDDAVEWVAAADAGWLRVVPTEGRLAARRSTRLRLRVADDAPEGELRGSVQITGRDGSASVVLLTTRVERAPDVAVTTAGCTVEATVEDEGEIAGAQLHWFEPSATPGDRPAERIEAMQATSTGFTGRLPNAGRPLTWWVTAADARGNQARTADQVAPADACP